MKITNVSNVDGRIGRNTSTKHTEVIDALNSSPTKMIKVECSDKREATNLSMAMRKKKGISARLVGLNVFVFYAESEAQP